MVALKPLLNQGKHLPLRGQLVHFLTDATTRCITNITPQTAYAGFDVISITATQHNMRRRLLPARPQNSHIITINYCCYEIVC